MSHTQTINFASENYAGVQPDMMQALLDVNNGHVRSYGNDEYTLEAGNLIRETFDADAEVYFTFNGTGANNFGLAGITNKYHSIFCSDVAHLYVDESTAPESFVGCRIFVIPSESGKITSDELRASIKRTGDIHHPQPKVVSLTQPTEYGTVYTIDELKAIKAICVDNNMLLHVDGARYFNATISLGTTLKQMTTDVGIDVLTLGGTKAGMMFGEAVIFFNKDQSEGYKYNLKRSMQLASKNRFIAAQFIAMLTNKTWHKLAAHTNSLAKEFEKRIAEVPSIKIVHPVQTNAVFLKMSPALHEKMQQHAHFYYWNDLKEEVRLIFSFDNTTEEIDRFIKLLVLYAGGQD
jgi:threonine aldolase